MKRCVLLILYLFAFSTSVISFSADAKKTYTIGVCQSNLGEPWRVQMNADIRLEAGKHPELKVIFKDAQNDVLKQCSHVHEFINDKVDLIIVPPKEGAPLTKAIADAVSSGIPVGRSGDTRARG